MSNATLKRSVRALLPRRIKPHRVLGGPLRGSRMVTSWHDYPAGILGKTEAGLLDWLYRSVAPGETWLDIGAHYGYTSIAISRLVQSSGRVFAFEPMIATAGHLYETRRLDGLHQLSILPLGLGNPAGGIEIQHLPATRGMIDSSIESAPSEMLLVARFDSLWPRICGGARRIDGVKIDVQGMELAVLRGMEQSLAEYRPKLVIELHRGVNRGSVLDLIARAGYPDRAIPIEPLPGETTPRYVDDRSYAFIAAANPASIASGAY